MRRREFLGGLGAAIAIPHPARAQRLPETPRRILLIANIRDEAQALMDVLLDESARHPDLGAPTLLVPRDVRPKRDSDVVVKPRCVIGAPKQGPQAAAIEVWCLYDLMSEMVNGSNTDEKGLALRKIFSLGKPADAVIGFGTGAFPSRDTRNGCVAVGGTVFLHDAKGGGSIWSWPHQMEKLIPSKTPSSFYQALVNDRAVMDAIRARMQEAPVNPARPPAVIVSPDAVAVSSVNIASTADYALVDYTAVGFAQAAGVTEITSVETTHAVIRRYCADAPFIFVTGIPNRIGQFDKEAQGNNQRASRNAGVVASWILPTFLRAISA